MNKEWSMANATEEREREGPHGNMGLSGKGDGTRMGSFLPKKEVSLSEDGTGRKKRKNLWGQGSYAWGKHPDSKTKKNEGKERMSKTQKKTGRTRLSIGGLGGVGGRPTSTDNLNLWGGQQDPRTRNDEKSQKETMRCHQNGRAAVSSVHTKMLGSGRRGNPKNASSCESAGSTAGE